jgi:hypothetical protein
VFGRCCTRVSRHLALHTDHCPPERLDGFLRPLLARSRERLAAGRALLFQSHMWDGSSLPLEQNLAIAAELLAECTRAIADHVFRHYDGVLRVDGDVGRKEVYDPWSYGCAGEA